MIAMVGMMVGIAWQKPVVNPLKNTRWKGLIFAPGAVEGVFSFKKDSLMLYAGTQVIETMWYQTKADTLLLKKLSGGSPCNDEVGQYKFLVKNDLLTLTVIKDGCESRTAAFAPEGYKKQ